MDFSVTRISQGLVAPAGPTPSGVLEVSVIDRLPVLRCNARTLHIFRHGPGAAQVIREALSKALIPYYPLAGRLHVSDQNELQIACSGQGIWFVDASADCTLDAVNYFDDDAMAIPYEKLLPTTPSQETDPLVQMQVTQFGCQGFVIGLIFCHSICDGLGAAQFLKAVGEVAARGGAEQLSVTPEWCRNFLPPPHPNPNPNPNPNPLRGQGLGQGQSPIPIPIPDYRLEHATIDLAIEKIKELKQEFKEWSGKSCSTFEIVAAMLWTQRTRAIEQDTVQQAVKLVFFANCRQLVEPPLPKGFYGNCFFPVTVTASSKEEGWPGSSSSSSSESVFRAVKLIQEAKAGLPVEFAKWMERSGIGGGGPGSEEEEDPFAPPLEYSTLFISEWGRLGFEEVDYGWGRPVHVVPIQGSSIIPVAIVCCQPRPITGVRLMTWCVQQIHLQPLLHSLSL